MDNSINIANILKEFPNGVSLYSTTHGYVELSHLYNPTNNIYPIEVVTSYKSMFSFTAYGKFMDCEDADCCLFPSKEMRDWYKFFKKGDVVYNKYSKMYAIFSDYLDKTYTEFNTTFNLYGDGTTGEDEVCLTNYFCKVPKDSQEYKDVMQAFGKSNKEEKVEKAEKKKTDDIECDFTPFEKVVVRSGKSDKWRCGIFSHYDKENGKYFTTDGPYGECVSYNVNTKELLGTAKKYVRLIVK